jgi:hypothetical protein
MSTRKIVKNQHSKKTLAFVKACAAYSFITIPSIKSHTKRLDLYLITGHTALANLCLGQADACFEAAIQFLTDFPHLMDIDGRQRKSEEVLQPFILKLLSVLVFVPVQNISFTAYLFKLYINFISGFS